MTTATTGRTQRSEADGEELAGRHRPWWMPWVVAAAVAVAVVAIGSYLVYGRDVRVASMADGGHVVPTVTGYYQGDEILFLHTEASDPRVVVTSATTPSPACSARTTRSETPPPAGNSPSSPPARS